jgi:hypothetical protein
MRKVTLNKIPLELSKKAASVAFIHDMRHWSVKKKIYKTPYGDFAVRAAKTIIVRLIK